MGKKFGLITNLTPYLENVISQKNDFKTGLNLKLEDKLVIKAN